MSALRKLADAGATRPTRSPGFKRFGRTTGGADPAVGAAACPEAAAAHASEAAARRSQGTRAAACEPRYFPPAKDGSARLRIVCSPGAASSTRGMVLTVIEAVATSPW